MANQNLVDDGVVRICRKLELAEGPHFSILVCANSRAGEIALAHISEQIGRVMVFPRSVRKPISDFEQLVGEVLQPLLDARDSKGYGAFVIDMTDERPAPDIWPRFCHRLNEIRNSLMDGLPAPLLLLATEANAITFGREAPDFWSIRSGMEKMEQDPSRSDFDYSRIPLSISVSWVRFLRDEYNCSPCKCDPLDKTSLAELFSQPIQHYLLLWSSKAPYSLESLAMRIIREEPPLFLPLLVDVKQFASWVESQELGESQLFERWVIGYFASHGLEWAAVDGAKGQRFWLLDGLDRVKDGLLLSRVLVALDCWFNNLPNGDRSFTISCAKRRQEMRSVSVFREDSSIWLTPDV